MVYRGHIRNGMVVFDEELSLPEGMEVKVEPVDTKHRRTLAERFKNIIGSVTGLPDDMAANHDHYIHGTPRK